MIHPSTRINFYKRDDIREEIINSALNKEIAIKYGDKGFGKRPDILQYAKDVLEFAKNGATSFHCSEELWQNPLQLSPGMRRQELDELRKGWDLVLDIDCKWLEYSTLAADLVVQALKYHGISSVSVKFSGNHGFHIAMPFEAFPEIVNDEPVKQMFPEAPRKIAAYIKSMTAQKLGDAIMEHEKGGFGAIKRKLGLPEEKIKAKKKTSQGNEFYLNTDGFLEIDTILISSRHMYRMPYSFNEKAGLVSVPVNPKKILEFTKDFAVPEKVFVEHDFLKRKGVDRREAKKLLLQALDFHPVEQDIKLKTSDRREFETPDAPVPIEHFPPCIKCAMQGLSDGRQRATFIINNFLSTLGWNYDRIEEFLKECNKKNPEPMRENLLLAPLRYHKQKKKKVLPPNCKTQYYSALGICRPDALCGANSAPGAPDFASKIKNPVLYALRKQKLTYLTKKKEKASKVK